MEIDILGDFISADISVDEITINVIRYGPDDFNSFVGLNDTPSDYIGQAGKIPIVNLTEDGLRFSDISSSCNSVELIGDGITDNSIILNAYIAGLNASDNLIITLCEGDYLFKGQINISGINKIILINRGAEIKPNTTDSILFNITNVNEVVFNGVNINFENQTTEIMAIKLTTSKGSVRFRDCDFKNFQTASTIAINLVEVPEDLPPANGVRWPSAIIEGCTFYNENDYLWSDYDYNDNNSHGIGIVLDDLTEYSIIGTSIFSNIASGIIIKNGAANHTIHNCKFHYLNANNIALDHGGIFIEDSSVGGKNYGKINIIGCTMNHMWSYAIRGQDSQGGNIRPIFITDCFFIANATTNIVFFGNYNMSAIRGCFFDRWNVATGIDNSPFTGSYYCIWARATKYISISENHFSLLADGSPEIIYSDTTSNYWRVSNNIYPAAKTLTNIAGANNQEINNLSII